MVLFLTHRWLLSRCGYMEIFDIAPSTAVSFAQRVCQGYNRNMPYVNTNIRTMNG